MTGKNNQVVEFVPLLNFENDYEILNVYPFTIRKRTNHYEIKESPTQAGYTRVKLNHKDYFKHRLIALQFIPNPNSYPDVDHINHNRSDYHISNLRWISSSNNSRNKSSHKGVQYRYVDEIDPESLVVDYYETKTERHYFSDYYYNDGVFYYDNDANYRILNVNVNKSGSRYVSLVSSEGKHIKVYIHRFLEQHDLE